MKARLFIKIDRIILQDPLDRDEENVPVAADISNDGNILIAMANGHNNTRNGKN